MKQKIKKVIALVGAVYGLVLAIGIIYDIYMVVTESDNYVDLFNISPNALHWQFLSITNLIVWDVFSALFYIAILIINLLFYIKGYKYLFPIIVVMDLLIIAFVIRFFILFSQSGYDHYPGFDPYLF